MKVIISRLEKSQIRQDSLYSQPGAQALCEQFYEVLFTKQRFRIQQPIFEHRIGTGLTLAEHLTPP